MAESGNDGPFYGHDLSGAKATTGAGRDATIAGTLAPLWQIATEGAVSATPVIAAGVVYAGSYDGNLYAVDLASGTPVWNCATGAAVPEPNLGIDLGITGSAAVADGIVAVPATDWPEFDGPATPAFAPFVRPGSSIVAFTVGGGGSLATPMPAKRPSPRS